MPCFLEQARKHSTSSNDKSSGLSNPHYLCQNQSPSTSTNGEAPRFEHQQRIRDNTSLWLCPTFVSSVLFQSRLALRSEGRTIAVTMLRTRDAEIWHVQGPGKPVVIPCDYFDTPRVKTTVEGHLSIFRAVGSNLVRL